MDDDVNDAHGDRAFSNSLLCQCHTMTRALESLCNEKGGFASMINRLSQAQTLANEDAAIDRERMQELVDDLRYLSCKGTLANGGSMSQIKHAFQARCDHSCYSSLPWCNLKSQHTFYRP